MKFFKNLLRDEAGATAIEYGLIAALIAVAAITAMQGSNWLCMPASVRLPVVALHGGDRGNGDQSGNQAVFDGGGASFIAKQVLEKLHGQSPGFVFVPGSTPVIVGSSRIPDKDERLRKS